jgi:hypothetical protein
MLVTIESLDISQVQHHTETVDDWSGGGQHCPASNFELHSQAALMSLKASWS